MTEHLLKTLLSPENVWTICIWNMVFLHRLLLADCMLLHCCTETATASHSLWYQSSSTGNDNPWCELSYNPVLESLLTVSQAAATICWEPRTASRQQHWRQSCHLRVWIDLHTININGWYNVTLYQHKHYSMVECHQLLQLYLLCAFTVNTDLVHHCRQHSHSNCHWCSQSSLLQIHQNRQSCLKTDTVMLLTATKTQLLRGLEIMKLFKYTSITD